MFKKKLKNTETTTQELIDAANSRLFSLEPDSADYDTVLKQLERLHKLAAPERAKRQISSDALLAAGVSIGSILIIVSYEHLHPIASKALGFVKK